MAFLNGQGSWFTPSSDSVIPRLCLEEELTVFEAPSGGPWTFSVTASPSVER